MNDLMMYDVTTRRSPCICIINRVYHAYYIWPLMLFFMLSHHNHIQRLSDIKKFKSLRHLSLLQLSECLND